MKSYRKTLTFEVPERMGFVHCTPEVEDALSESGIREGLCLVNSLHITWSIFINDDEPGLHEDYARWLEELAPHDPSPEARPGPTTTARARTAATRTASRRSWAARSWSP